MRFDPVSSRRNFTTVKDPDYFKPQIEEAYATEMNGFSPDVETEIGKVEGCELMIWQFPLWWFGLPAVLKGWVDRVFTMGRVYGGGRWFSDGALRGRRAMCALTTGGPEGIYGSRGRNGSLDKVLFHVQHGMLAFVGYEVLPPFVAWSAARVGDDGRARYLGAYRERLLTLDTTPPIPFHPLEHFDEKLQLKAEFPGEV
jgi:NAD(P)H dehydrogenase (quinone)